MCNRPPPSNPCSIENRLKEYMEQNRKLENQMKSLRVIIRNMYQDLTELQEERDDCDDMFKKPSCPPTPCSGNCPIYDIEPPSCDKHEVPTCKKIIKDLFKKYSRLQNKFKFKEIEVMKLKCENERLREQMEKNNNNRKCFY
ncbi:chromosome partition protein Smc-like [Diabrotica virgifera virgifera]|uniref:Uncharacterized protein LOC114341816 n=1 Tax=Diabrotica virgifera virgifera TaxID=50390 RepID=A0A6P7GQW3_DIAVI|nr:chromosome partition protein Smc-like [Diabrotica virgifera virgifera]